MAEPLLPDAEIAIQQGRRTSFTGLLAIEDNPLTADEVTMFDMFDQRRWSDDRCRQYIIDQLHEPA